MGSKNSVRKILMMKHGGRCFYCERMMTLEPHPELLCTIDHVVPRSDGGVDHMSNYVAACTRCNSARGTIPSAAFKRYVRRFGVVWSHKMALCNRARRRAAEHMTDNGMSEVVINDILRVRIEEARARLAG